MLILRKVVNKDQLSRMLLFCCQIQYWSVAQRSGLNRYNYNYIVQKQTTQKFTTDGELHCNKQITWTLKIENEKKMSYGIKQIPLFHVMQNEYYSIWTIMFAIQDSQIHSPFQHFVLLFSPILVPYLLLLQQPELRHQF